MSPPRSDETERWYSSVYMAVQEIPRGKVTTYGHIARLICERKQHHFVGQALKYLPEPRDAYGNVHVFNHGNVPWQRVVASKGMVPKRYVSYDPSGAGRQAQRLRAEGVEVIDVNGEFLVDLKGFGWFPERLPSEEGDRDEEG
ncbi:MGMT family protein [Terfezia boudieri ATCC MYA-4762]|uniref:MGMT family protein n=1 Tax=Terfezia boudieri ATCC MYA-4762 TaxID=1051890 RepID=A0A3N4LKQ2_9PEZI|nr:MGMT family protein [Terfezia boudieri ATCC MYA-4762]